MTGRQAGQGRDRPPGVGPPRVEVVGTLAAVDQVTCRPKPTGKVSRILARPRRSRDGRAGARSSSTTRSSNTTSTSRKRRWRARSRSTARPTRSICPTIEKTPDVQKASADLAQAKQAYDRANELFKRTLVPRQTLDDAETTRCSRRRRATNRRCRTRRTSRASIQASEATMKLADRQFRDTEIRAPFDGYVEKRLRQPRASWSRPQMPVMAVVRVDPLKVIAEIPEKMAPWISDRPAGASCTSTPIRTRRSPARCRASALP